MAEPGPTRSVVVRWCGASYPVEVPSNATIADLKRKFSEVESLPCKRQRFKDNTWERNYLDDGVLVSSLASNILNLVGVNQKDGDNYKQIFWAHSTAGVCHSTDLREPLIDFDATRVGMSRGTYEAVTIKVDCLLKTEEENTPLDLASFGLMRNFKHANSLAMESLYESGQSLRLILLDSVDGTFAGYVKKWGTSTVFNSDTGTITPFFSNIMTELCGVVDKLVADGICPKSLSTHNLYLKMVGDDPHLKVLFNSVEPLAKTVDDDENEQLTKLCADIQGIFSAYVPNEVKPEMTHLRSFLGEQAVKYIGKNLGKIVKCYPYNWTDTQKSSYLIDLISCTTDIRPLINTCGISWPMNQLGNDVLDELKTIQKLLEDHNKVNLPLKLKLQREGNTAAAKKIKVYIWNYKTEYPYDLVRLARNLWKHFDTYPWDVKKILGHRREGALHALERWIPGVWSLVYNAVVLA